MTAYQEQWKKRGEVKLKFSGISKKLQLNDGPSAC